MSASLVGSEMCIRDRLRGRRLSASIARAPEDRRDQPGAGVPGPRCRSATVSYTHLTLPTICSV
eukprot:1428007-Alexandrium_andersonii.AAC.1